MCAYFQEGFVFQSDENSRSSDSREPTHEGKKQLCSLGDEDAKYPAAVSPT